ncbi:MAG TPA: hypothetical protein VF470_09835 [Sphingomicrobium sp.]
MKLAIRTTTPGYPKLLLAFVAVFPLVSELPSSSVSAAPCSFESSIAARAATALSSDDPSPSLAMQLELAGKRKRDRDDNFDPYGKDDPTNKKWGGSAGLNGNRYGGLRTGGEAKKSGQKNSDRDDRDARPPRGEDGRD